ncbi:ABC transporter substrate-binding protein [Nakamurella deserti]|uniref:ABC transporter substrate-binding protein n=1 Tax=Nakamurella deserti TaxID=2164074 RepID=UPI000DBE99AB|nr:ABC transporter substrate-binding protein [Nakamurella deserti]
MRTRSTALAALVSAAALVLTACGGSSDPLSSAPSTTPSSSTPTSSASSAPTSADSSATGSAGATESSAGGATGSETAGGTVKIGSANFPESALLAEIYAGALEAKGLTVEKTLNIGNREAYYKALQDGSIDLIPEYSGALLSYKDKAATAVSAEDVYAALPAVVQPDGLEVLEPSQAEDNDSLVVTQETAQQYNLKTIADLAPVAGELTLGAAAEFETRADGIPGLQKNYGVTFKSFTALDPGGPLSINALKGGQVDVTDIFTTDPSIAANNWVVLEDPKNNFRAQQILPLVRSSLAGQTAEALNAVSAKLTTENLTELLVRVYSNEPAETVAKDWLSQNGLV